MKVQRFNVNLATNKDKVYTIHGRKPLRQMVINSYNSQGYKLYYYNNFELIEITSLAGVQNNWKNTWGEIIFFLNEEEHASAIKIANKSKELYDKHIESANTISKLPLSYIYDNVLKLG